MTEHETVSGYLDALASSAPTPGGGSVAALVNALGCALGEMVAALSNTVEHPEVHEAAERLRQLRGESVAAKRKDEDAYAGYIAATKLPTSTPAEKSTRRAAMQTALVAAAEAPLALAEVAVETLAMLRPIAAHGNRHALSDARIGAMLANLAVRAALVNVRINIALIRDAETASDLSKRSDAIERSAADRFTDIEAQFTAAPS